LIATFIVIFILLAATAAAFAYRRQQQLLAARRQHELREHRPPRSLFADTQLALDESARARPEQPTGGYMEQRAALMSRVAADDLTALDDAHRAGDAALYRVVLNGLVERAAKSDERLNALAAHLKAGDGLRGSVELAEAYGAFWHGTPDRTTTATMLHLAALADDADTYRKAAEIACLFWQGGQLDGFSGAELRELIDSQYWLISSDARRTGAGFVLKQKLNELRAALADGAGAAAAPGDASAPEPDRT
jgi:hypothetical protein